MRRYFSTLTMPLFFLSATEVFAQPPKNTPTPRFAVSKQTVAPPNSSRTLFELSAGTGEYPILAMPVLSQGETRADGSTSESDLQVNHGALLGLNIGRSIPTSFAKYSVNLGVERVASAPGGGLPTPSSYVRLHAQAGAGFDLGTDFLGLFVSPAVEARRSMYRNVESGHYIDAIILKSSLEKRLWSDGLVSMTGGYAPITRFGLLRNSDLGKSGALSDTTSSLWDVGTRLTWSPDQSTSFHVAVSQESVTAKLNSSDGYKSYGLPVAPFSKRAPNRVYDLTTRQIAIGTTKIF